MLDVAGTITVVTIPPILPHGPPKLAAYGKKPAGYALRRILTRYSRRALGGGSAISKNGIPDELMSIELLGGLQRPPREAVEASRCRSGALAHSRLRALPAITAITAILPTQIH
jgi:hypothetical protein